MSEPKTIEWMTEQRDRLKQEVDVLNPKLDAATAKLALQDRDLAAVRNELAAVQADRANVEAELAKEKAAAKRQAEIVSGLNAAASKNVEELRRTQRDLHAALDLAEKRRLALADVLNHASGLVAKVMPLINQ